MAFYQQAPVPARRVPAYEPSVDEPVVSTATACDRHNEPQRLVILNSNSISLRTQTDQFTQTAGRSQLSDFGSLNTIPPSDEYGEEVSAILEGEEGDLDSLDDGLQAFQEPLAFQSSRRIDHSGGSILPAHDGLGTFEASSNPVQDHIWSYEKYNPRRRELEHHRRRSSVQRLLDAVQDDSVPEMEAARMERIEKWRIQQSRILHEEIEKATKKRIISGSGDISAERRLSSSTTQTESGQIDTGNQAFKDGGARDNGNENSSANTSTQESLWQRITQRFVRDVLGIDDVLLSIIFGESYLSGDPPPPSAVQSSVRLASDEALKDKLKFDGTFSGLEDSLLRRLARDLETLIKELSELSSPFPSFSNTQQATMDYAGIPIDKLATELKAPLSETYSIDLTNPQSPSFKPTLPVQHPDAQPEAEHAHAARWGIEDSSHSQLAAEVAYWEEMPDLRTIFRYLSSRFTSSPIPAESTAKGPNTPQPTSSKPFAFTSPNPRATNSPIATTTPPSSLHRAALIRAHHPLVSSSRRHQHYQSRRPRHLRQLSSPLLSPSFRKRSGSSCASLSTRKSRKLATGLGSGSSRNFWDWGGSSAETGAEGWGEV